MNVIEMSVEQRKIYIRNKAKERALYKLNQKYRGILA